MTNEPLDELLNKFANVMEDSNDELPQMPFPTSYVLTREQEENLVEHALQRIDDLEDESGRAYTKYGDWWNQELDLEEDDTRRMSPERTFMGKRRLYELLYQNNVEWRETVIGGIFEHSNLVVPIARRIARQMTARGNQYFFGTDPWFAAYAIGEEDKDLANKADKYTRYKASKANLRASLETAVNKSFVLGEHVLKTTHSIKEQPYQRREVVLIGADGEPILSQGPDGDFITEKDKWDPESGLLMRDQATPMPLNPVFEERLINRRITEYNGPSVEGIPYQDFLCPLSAPTVQEADCCAHLYDVPAMTLADQWAKRGTIDLNAVEQEEVTRRAIEVLRKISTGGQVSEDDPQRSALGERQNTVTQDNSIVEIAEIYIRYDANNDGILEEIVLFVDRKNKVPIFYDFVANITPDGLRPFSVVKINKELGYWHGQGVIEMFESSQKIMDLLINRWEFSLSKQARVDFWQPGLTEEGAANPNLELNTGQTYTPRPGVKVEEILQTVSLYDVTGDDTQNLLEFFLQLTMNESGVNHANDSAMAGLDSQKLATGIRNVEKTGQEMFSVYISDLEPGIANVLEKFKDTLYDYLDPEEVVTYFEGDANELLEINAQEIENLDLSMNLVMTRQHGMEVLESNRQAAELVTVYYQHLSPDVQVRVAPFYRDMLRALKIKDVDKVINPLEPQEPAPLQSGSPALDPNMAQASQEPMREAEPNL